MSVNPSLQEQLIQKAASLLQQSELVVIPTETVYGLAANATDDNAIKKIYALKGRPNTNPLICHVADTDSLLRWINPGDQSRYKSIIKKLKIFWPGPLSVVVPKHPDISSSATAQQSTVGLRIPNHPLIHQLLKTVHFPLAAPSANHSNYISPTKAEHVKKEFGAQCPFILDGGECQTGIESTVLSLINIDSPVILRPGAITKEQLERALGMQVKTSSSENIQTNVAHPQISPGQLSIHYSPKTKLSLLRNADFGGHLPARIGLIAFSNHLAIDFDFAAIRVLSENKNAEEIAVSLYDALRDMDALKLDLILIDECEPVGLGAAIMDRIYRACSS